MDETEYEDFRIEEMTWDWGMPCFVTGKLKKTHTKQKQAEGQVCLVGFVNSRESGERVVQMFDDHAKLEYYDFRPTRGRVLVSASDDHTHTLMILAKKIAAENKISREMIQAAKREGNIGLEYYRRNFRRGQLGTPKS